MKRKLVVTENGRAREMLFVDTIAVGRDPQCEISGSDPLLSRRHAEFEPLPDRVVVRDLQSRNGITLNGKKVDEGVMRPGDRVFVAGIRIEYVEEAGGEDSEDNDAKTIRTPVHVESPAAATPVASGAPSPPPVATQIHDAPRVAPAVVTQTDAARDEDDRTRVVPREAATGQSSLRLRPQGAVPTAADQGALAARRARDSAMWRVRGLCVAYGIGVVIVTAALLIRQESARHVYELVIAAMFAVVAGLAAAHFVDLMTETQAAPGADVEPASEPAAHADADLALQTWPPAENTRLSNRTAARSR